MCVCVCVCVCACVSVCVSVCLCFLNHRQDVLFFLSTFVLIAFLSGNIVQVFEIYNIWFETCL